ncbi:DUF5686 and carboxypeptidase regulatory-like domain-containing protein [bacterium]|nr:DUF5686 and carboxypeptidase regulatory-like domain-containing protein [bacterium]
MQFILFIILQTGIIFSFSLQKIYCQSQTARGIVYDSTTLSPLPYAKVIFQKGKLAVLTDENGIFFLRSRLPIDSIQVSFLGFNTQTKAITSKEEFLEFYLYPSEFRLNEVVIVSEERENPAHPIIRKAIAHKPLNDRSRLEAYQYEAYEKTEIDINNFDEKVQKQLIFKPIQFVFEHIDTIGGTPYLPMFLTETLKDVYYKAPKTQKEYIKATRTSGVENTGFAQLINSLYEDVNVYENNMEVFDKSFVSPISDAGFRYYKYYLMDSLRLDEHFCYHIYFTPKRKQELTFSGDIYLTQSSYAVKKLEAKMSQGANLNYITAFDILQINEEVGPGFWMPVKESLVATAAIFIPHEARTQEFLARKNTSYKSFVLNRPLQEGFYQNPSITEVAKVANLQTEDYWISNRHDTLSIAEKAVYTMVDSIKRAPLYKLVRTLARGYVDFGKFEIGPLFTIYSFNPIEGSRFKLGGRTTKSFSEQTLLSGYLAYGQKDERFKFGAKFKHRLSGNPRQVFTLNVSHDVEQLGLSPHTFRNDNLLASLFRINPATKLNRVPAISAEFEHEWLPGFSNKLTLSWRTLYPLGDLTFSRQLGNGQLESVPSITTSEIALSLHFAWQEKFLGQNLRRLSLGTPFPVLDAQYAGAIKGLFGGDYEYHRATVSIRQKIKLGRTGKIRYRLEGGKIWGEVPYPLLKVHTGNETFFYDTWAFNTMNFFEFVSNEYALGSLSYHMEGWLLNKLPLVRKLKWREVFSTKAVMGRLSPEDRQEMILPVFIHSLNDKPFSEVSVGIENIFRFLRVDAIWRLNYLDNPDIRRFKVKFRIDVDF